MKKVVAVLIMLFIIPTGAVLAETLKIGIVPQAKSQVIKKNWQPIIDALKSRGIAVEFVGAPSIPAFEKALKAGEYDIAYMNPYHLLVANRAQGYLPVVRDHGKELKGILVVHKDTDITKINELSGETMAFPAPNALGASLLMRAELDNQQKVALTPKYVKTHKAVYRNVAFKRVKAGGGVLRTFNKQPDSIKSKLKVVYTTQGVAPHPIAVHPRVPKATREKIQQIFLELGESASGAAMLKKIPMKKIGIATLDDYKLLETLNLQKYAK